MDIVAPRMPEPALPRGLQALGNRERSGGILAQQKLAHGLIFDISSMQEVEQFTRHRVGSFGEVDEPIDRLGKFRRAARAVAYLAGDEARVDSSSAYNA